MAQRLVDRLGEYSTAPIPPAHLGLTFKPITHADIPAIKKLIIDAELHLPPQRSTTETELKMVTDFIFESPYADGLCGFDKNQVLQSFTAVYIHDGNFRQARADLFASTHPTWRGKGVGRFLLKWQDIRARQLLIEKYGKDCNYPVLIRNSVDGEALERRRLYTAAGFSVIRVIPTYLLKTENLRVLENLNSQQYQLVWGSDLDEYQSQIKELYYLRAAGSGANLTEIERWWKYLWEKKTGDFSLALVAEGKVKAFCLGQYWDELLLAVNPDHTTVSLEGLGMADPTDSMTLRLLLQLVAQAAKTQKISALRAEDSFKHNDTVGSVLEEIGFIPNGDRKIYAIEC